MRSSIGCCLALFLRCLPLRMFAALIYRLPACSADCLLVYLLSLYTVLHLLWPGFIAGARKTGDGGINEL